MTSVIPEKRGFFSGFTFIELMLVIVIIAVLAGVAFPRLARSLNAINLSSASAEVQSVINSLSQRAVVERNVYFIRFDAAENKYIIYQKSASTPIEIKSYAIPEDVVLNSDAAEVYFYPDGSIDNVTISLTDKNHQVNYITTKGIFSVSKLSASQ